MEYFGAGVATLVCHFQHNHPTSYATMAKLWNKLLAPTGGSQSLLRNHGGPKSDLFNDDDSSSLSGREPKKKSASNTRRMFVGRRLMRRTKTAGEEDGYGASNI